MGKLLDDHNKYVAQAKAKGVNFITLSCPICNKEIETRRGIDNTVWDSLATCPYCESIYLKITDGGKATAEII
ncbi:hypothetical protein N0H69_12470 [Yersinia alsatica]|uniref:Uncharacterized protein n=1 Tax=Yersinia alsatica TaxID=2890317 RepID=A0ABY5UJ65_9GAMM|nr:hypothetical protein [Yersinia alsatica]OWF69087.1 hypothetical protein B4901_08670 [Yersinia frederiksenii]UWM43544.1 hypothetical protein N0H69_12470 [Yersinia alsatica]CNI27128.1 Uncharacterised protein [Yersinia frederiksenii]CNK67565.1 Uncharacterised protein [Yersinia frederiksenii]CNL54901.1 Uncharacterised protein [Yersinia frederiksenii]